MDHSSHRHVSIWLQDGLKWTTHTDKVICQAEPNIADLKYHRFHFSKKALRQMYMAFVRPIMEYASPIGCNATTHDLIRLEYLNITAMRCIVGAKLGTSHANLYRDSSIDPLRDRQLAAQLMLARDTFLETRQSRINSLDFVTISRANPYSLRATTILRPIKCRTELYRSSFLPSSVKLLNKYIEREPLLLTDLSRDQFKLKLYTKPVINPIYFYELSRSASIHTARIRCKNSNLKSDLFARSLSIDDNCDACGSVENANHFFMNCARYDNLRRDIVNMIPLECFALFTLL